MLSFFTTTLKDATLKWYYDLPKNLVNSFQTLIDKFKYCFTTNQPHVATFVALKSLK